MNGILPAPYAEMRERFLTSIQHDRTAAHAEKIEEASFKLFLWLCERGIVPETMTDVDMLELEAYGKTLAKKEGV